MNCNYTFLYFSCGKKKSDSDEKYCRLVGTRAIFLLNFLFAKIFISLSKNNEIGNVFCLKFVSKMLDRTYLFYEIFFKITC